MNDDEYPGRWFGEPWPSADRRAPVCEDDSMRAVTPVGIPCGWCAVKIEPDDQGMLIPYIGGPPFPMDLIPHHRACMLAMAGVTDIPPHHTDYSVWPYPYA